MALKKKKKTFWLHHRFVPPICPGSEVKLKNNAAMPAGLINGT
jgi:hypothetical protein